MGEEGAAAPPWSRRRQRCSLNHSRWMKSTSSAPRDSSTSRTRRPPSRSRDPSSGSRRPSATPNPVGFLSPTSVHSLSDLSNRPQIWFHSGDTEPARPIWSDSFQFFDRFIRASAPVLMEIFLFFSVAAFVNGVKGGRSYNQESICCNFGHVEDQRLSSSSEKVTARRDLQRNLFLFSSR